MRIKRSTQKEKERIQAVTLPQVLTMREQPDMTQIQRMMILMVKQGKEDSMKK